MKAIRHSFSQQSRFHGISISEVLCVLAIISLLFAIIVPAVLQARERSRDTTCLNRLKQIGIAVHNFEAAHNAFPAPQNHLRELLPYLDQENLYDELKSAASNTSRGATEFFVCPSDTFASPDSHHSNYRLNIGTSLSPRRFNGMVESSQLGKQGITGTGEGVHEQFIRDGLSNTVMYSERLVQPPLAGVLPGPNFDTLALSQSTRFLWWPTRTYGPGLEAELGDACQVAANRLTAAIPDANRDYAFRAFGSTYAHISLPNLCGCFTYVPYGPTVGADSPGNATTPASSGHHGTVNVLFADGGCRAFSDSVSAEVWRGIGTRDQSDVLPAF